MTCSTIQDQLLECFGQASLPENLARHIELCQGCREYWDELSLVATVLPNNDAFALEEWELDAAVASVDRAIDRMPVPWTSRVRLAMSRWLAPLTELRPIPAAAAAALVLALALTVPEIEQTAVESESVDLLLSENAVELDEDEIEDPDDITVEALLAEYTSLWQTGSADLLLDDITTEEYEYLAQSLNAGDLL